MTGNGAIFLISYRVTISKVQSCLKAIQPFPETEMNQVNYVNYDQEKQYCWARTSSPYALPFICQRQKRVRKTGDTSTIPQKMKLSNRTRKLFTQVGENQPLTPISSLPALCAWHLFSNFLFIAYCILKLHHSMLVKIRIYNSVLIRTPKAIQQ